MPIVYIEGSQIISSKNKLYSFVSRTNVLANSAEPDEMGLYMVFYLGLHCLPNSTRLCVSGLRRVKLIYTWSLNSSLASGDLSSANTLLQTVWS